MLILVIVIKLLTLFLIIIIVDPNKYYCKIGCLHSHMLVLHSMTVVVDNVRHEDCAMCGVKHELYVCRKCKHILDCNGEHELLVRHELSCKANKDKRIV